MHSIIATRSEGEVLRDLAVGALPALLEDPGVHIWVDIAGPLDTEDERILRDVFKFHPLALEDCYAAREHPKVDNFGDYIYVITHGLLAGSTAEEAGVIEVDAFAGKRFLVTYHEQPSRSIATVREQILRESTLLRRSPTLVLHAIYDVQLEGIEEVVEGIEILLEELEIRVITTPASFDLEGLLALKRTNLKLRRWMSRQREVMLRLSRQEVGMVSAGEAALFRDLFDHFSRITDLLESFREMANSILDVHLATSNNRLGEIMKFLTLFTAILMPLTVITGIYGMNFDVMPELRHPLGYPAVLLAMVATALFIVRFFRKRGWIGASAAPEMTAGQAGRTGSMRTTAGLPRLTGQLPTTSAWSKSRTRRTASSIPARNP